MVTVGIENRLFLVIVVVVMMSLSGSSQEVDQCKLLDSLEVESIVYNKFVFYENQFIDKGIYRIDSINEKGLIDLKTIINEQGFEMNTEYEYYEDWDLYEIKRSKNGEAYFFIEEYYYEEDRLIEKIEYGERDSHEKNTTIAYGSNGLVKSKYIYRFDSNSSTEYEFHYFEGNKSRVDVISDDKSRYSIKYKYDINNNLIERYSYNDDRHWSHIEYEYSIKNQLTSKKYLNISFVISDLIHLSLLDVELRKDDIEYRFTYYDDTALLKERIEYHNGHPIAKLVLNYN